MMDSGINPVWINLSETDVNKRLEQSIIDVFHSYPNMFMYLDFNLARDKLCERQLLSLRYYDCIFRNISEQRLSSREQLFVFVKEIAKHVQPHTFFCILNLMDLSDLAELVEFKYSKPVPRQIHKAHIPFSEWLQEHFYDMKNKLDNADQAERRRLLSDGTEKLKASFGTIINENELSIKANKFAVNTWLCVQQCNRDTGEIRKKLIDMRAQSWPRNVDSVLSEIVFESKMAVVTAMEGSFGLANSHRRNAKILVHEFCDPFTKALVYHDSRYVSQMLSNNNFPYTMTVQKECEIALRLLEAETNRNNFCILMQRSFMLNSVQDYLHIGNDSQIDRTIPVSAENLHKAESMLHCVAESFRSHQTVENRRRMFYCVYIARFYDIKNEYQTAIDYLRRAKQLSESSAFFEQEKNNIETYILELENQ